MGELQERITSTRKGSITSVQAIYVPADDYTDPAPATTFAHLDATTNLSRAIVELGIYPAVDPLASTSRILDPRIIGDEHYNVAQQREADPAALQGPAGHHRDSRHRRAVGRRQAHRRRARARSRSSCRSRSSSPSSSPAPRASTCRSPRRSAASRRSSTASTTTFRSRRSTWSARSTRCSSRREGAAVGHGAPDAPSPRVRDARAGDRPRGRGRGRDARATTATSACCPGHAPLLAALRAGEMWYRKGAEKHYAFVAGGFAEVLPRPRRRPGAGRRARRGHRRRSAPRPPSGAPKSASRRPTADLDFERARIALLRAHHAAPGLATRAATQSDSAMTTRLLGSRHPPGLAPGGQRGRVCVPAGPRPVRRRRRHGRPRGRRSRVAARRRGHRGVHHRHARRRRQPHVAVSLRPDAQPRRQSSEGRVPSRQPPDRRGDGRPTTRCAAWRRRPRRCSSTDGKPVVAHVGDSRVYLWRDGTLHQITAGSLVGQRAGARRRADRKPTPASIRGATS